MDVRNVDGAEFVQISLQADWLNLIVTGAKRNSLSSNMSVAKLMKELNAAKKKGDCHVVQR